MKTLFIMALSLLSFNMSRAKKIVGCYNGLPRMLKQFSFNNDCVNLSGGKWMCNDYNLYLKDNSQVNDKKLISISPGGFNGFYMLGTATFIKENYKLDDFIYSGASAGAWTSLFMTYKHDPTEFVIKLLDDKLNNIVSIIDLEYEMKYKILNKYNEGDFNLNKLFIGVTSVENMKIKTHIFSNFDTLEDALNCCIASSHIPYITGTTFLNKYNNMNTFDGGFSNYPYLNVIKPSLHITPRMWKDYKNSGKQLTCAEKMLGFSAQVSDYTTLFSRSRYHFMDLFDSGYNDAKKNKLLLNDVFISSD